MKGLIPGVLVLFALGCGEEDFTPPPHGNPPPEPPVPVPSALTIVSGNGQNATVGELLTQPLIVRVTSADGVGVSGVAVRWAIVSGGGELGIPQSATYTGVEGLASMTVLPIAPGPITVSASADGVPGAPATFTIDVTAGGPRPYQVLIRFGPLFDCGEFDGSVFSVPAGTIPLGSLVIWEAVWCPGQVVSVSVPPGGTPFDSGVIAAGHSWSVVLATAGDWEIKDALNGGTVTLRVR